MPCGLHPKAVWFPCPHYSIQPALHQWHYMLWTDRASRVSPVIELPQGSFPMEHNREMILFSPIEWRCWGICDSSKCPNLHLRSPEIFISNLCQRYLEAKGQGKVSRKGCVTISPVLFGWSFDCLVVICLLLKHRHNRNSI